MKVCIVGCGAIGSLFAAHLATQADVEVWAYDLDQAHVDAINRSGLRLSGKSTLHSRPKASSDPAAIPPCEFGIVATKSLHTRPAMAATAAIFRNGAVCSVQNGVGNEEIIAEYAPRVMRGTTFPAGRIIEPGHVQQDTGGKTWIGPFEPKPASMAEVTALADKLTQSGMETLAMADAAQHYIDVGAARGYAPNTWFDPLYYADRWDDLWALDLDEATLFLHYNLYGVWEGRSAGPIFDAYDGNRYLTDNPDVAAYVDAYVGDFLGSRTNGAIAHFVIYGAEEGRKAYDTAGNEIEMGIFL